MIFRPAMLCFAGFSLLTSSSCGAQQQNHIEALGDNVSKLPRLSSQSQEIYRRCIVGPVPQSMRVAPYSLSDFYQKYCDARGIPVIGSASVSDAALIAAHQRVYHMSGNVNYRQSMINYTMRVAIMAPDEVTTDIPEHSDLNTAFPETDWNVYRGLGATQARPAVSGAEENLLGLRGDIYEGEDILVHEFAHGLHELGISPIDSSFDVRLQAAFDAAKISGRWADTYAATNPREYWAEAVQSWYNRNQSADPTDGIHNAVDTRQELIAYDPAIAALIKDYLPSGAFPSDVY